LDKYCRSIYPILIQYKYSFFLNSYEDWYNLLKVFRYLKKNPNYGIKFSYNDKINLKVYVDADLGGDKETRRSTTGFLMLINSAPTSWFSKLQHCVSVSTAESEYYGIHECARHCLWYKNIFKEFGIKHECITINTDNKAAIYNCENETYIFMAIIRVKTNLENSLE